MTDTDDGWRARRARRRERRQRARERREVLLALDSADEPSSWARFSDSLSRTPPLLILLVGLAGDLLGTTALGIAYTLEHQQTKRIESGRAADHAIFCDFFGDLGALQIVLPTGARTPPTIKAFGKLFADGAVVHRRLACGPLPTATVIRPTPQPSTSRTRPTASPTPPPTGR